MNWSFNAGDLFRKILASLVDPVRIELIAAALQGQLAPLEHASPHLAVIEGVEPSSSR